MSTQRCEKRGVLKHCVRQGVQLGSQVLGRGGEGGLGVLGEGMIPDLGLGGGQE